MNVITIARQVGSWGDYIGVDVAKALEMRYIDREVITTAAERIGVSEQSLNKWEEEQGMIRRLIDNLSSITKIPSVPSQALRYSDHYSMVASDERFKGLVGSGFTQSEAARHVLGLRFPTARKTFGYLNLIRSVVTEFAREGNVVLAGSGSQIFLKDWKEVLHVLIIAPVEIRRKAIMEQEGVTLKVAESRVKENDAARAAFYKNQFKLDWLDANLYNLVIDTGRIPRELAADLIVKTAQALS
jgi:cytidylate kinase